MFKEMAMHQSEIVLPPSIDSRLKRNRSNKTAAICCIVKDDEAYIDEWVDYNLAIGFEHIYMYDNSDRFTLQKWGHGRRTVTVKHFPGEVQQMKAYRECLTTYAVEGHHEWIAIFDTDEFLVMRQHDHVVDLLMEHCATGALGISWFLFGTSNRTKYEPIPVTRRFLYRNRTINEHIKTIVRLADLKPGRMFRDPHYCKLLNATPQHDTRGGQFFGPYNPGGPTDVAVLHHYRYKSVAEFHHKACIRGRADTKMKDLCNLTAPCGDVYDDSAWTAMKKFVPKYRSYR